MVNKINKSLYLGSVGNKPTERTNALTLMNDSIEYFEFYQRGKPNKKVDISKVSYFLLMRSLELSLKALLKAREGISASKLKERETFGHDVGKLYSYCIEKHYLEPLNKEFGEALKRLNTYYKGKDFEYTQIGSKLLPRTDYVVSLVNEVHREFNKITQNTKIQRYL